MARPEPSGGFEWVQAPWGLALQCRPLLEAAHHLFTAGDLRLESESPEWPLVAQVLGVLPERVRLVRQVHGAAVAIVRRGGTGGWTLPEADALVSDDPAAALGIQVADCAPILLAERGGGAVAAVHAGWRGTLQRAALAGVDALRREFGSDPGRLIAAIGPCLGQCCGEVGDEVVEGFRKAGHPEEDLSRWLKKGESGKPYLDLAGANRDQLVQAGISPAAVHVAGLCTKTHAGVFHSYRAKGAAAGRMLGAIRPRGRGLDSSDPSP